MDADTVQTIESALTEALQTGVRTSGDVLRQGAYAFSGAMRRQGSEQARQDGLARFEQVKAFAEAVRRMRNDEGVALRQAQWQFRKMVKEVSRPEILRQVFADDSLDELMSGCVEAVRKGVDPSELDELLASVEQTDPQQAQRWREEIAQAHVEEAPPAVDDTSGETRQQADGVGEEETSASENTTEATPTTPTAATTVATETSDSVKEESPAPEDDETITDVPGSNRQEQAPGEAEEPTGEVKDEDDEVRQEDIPTSTADTTVAPVATVDAVATEASDSVEEEPPAPEDEIIADEASIEADELVAPPMTSQPAPVATHTPTPAGAGESERVAIGEASRLGADAASAKAEAEEANALAEDARLGADSAAASGDEDAAIGLDDRASAQEGRAKKAEADFGILTADELSSQVAAELGGISVPISEIDTTKFVSGKDSPLAPDPQTWGVKMAMSAQKGAPWNDKGTQVTTQRASRSNTRTHSQELRHKKSL